jgi:hypothetical protein
MLVDDCMAPCVNRVVAMYIICMYMYVMMRNEVTVHLLPHGKLYLIELEGETFSNNCDVLKRDCEVR